MYVPSPYPYLAVCRHLLVFPHTHTSAMLTLVCFFVHVQMETQICGNSGYDPPPLTHALLSFACFTLRSGMGNGLLTSFFSFFVQAVRLASPSSLLPAEPFSKGFVLYVCFAHPSAMLTLVCFFVHVQMETQICGNSGYYPPPLTHALLSFACFTLRSALHVSYTGTNSSLLVCVCRT